MALSTSSDVVAFVDEPAANQPSDAQIIPPRHRIYEDIMRSACNEIVAYVDIPPGEGVAERYALLLIKCLVNPNNQLSAIRALWNAIQRSVIPFKYMENALYNKAVIIIPEYLHVKALMANSVRFISPLADFAALEQQKNFYIDNSAQWVLATNLVGLSMPSQTPHPQQDSPWKGQQPKREHKCGVCNRVFAAGYNLRRHRQFSCAMWQDVHKCNSCNARYARPDTLKRHVSRKHLEAKRCNNLEKLFREGKKAIKE